ncbi:MAG: hypothetical protein INR70_08790 [Parafilimonas terrae]|nr:hypothetical protein [Parafilimonas terrae]
MALIRTLSFRTSVDVGGFFGALGRMESGATKFTRNITSGLTSVQNVVKATVTSMATLAAFDLAGKAVSGIQHAITAASDFNEIVGKADDVLGPASASVKAYADEMASKFGLVKAETLDAAASFGGIAKGLGGLTGGELASASKQLTTLASDLSSFGNMSFKDAASALRTTLAGEQSDVLKGLGVTINETSVKAYGLSHGYKAVGGAFSEADKFAIRQKLLMEQLGDVHGNLANTIGGTANAWRRFTGTMTNVATSIGTTLLPAVNKAIGMVTAIGVAISEFVSTNQGSFDAVAAAIGYAFDLVQAHALNVWPAISGTIGIVASAVMGLAEYVVGFLPSFATFSDGVKAVFTTAQLVVWDVTESLRALPDEIEAAFGGEAIAWVTNLATWVKDGLAAGLSYAGFVARNFGSLAQIAFIQAGAFVGYFLDQAALIPRNLLTIGEWMGDNFLQIVSSPFLAIGELLKELGKSIWEFMKNPTGGIQFDGSKILDSFKAVSDSFPELAAAAWQDTGPDIERLQQRIADREADYNAMLGPGVVTPEFQAAAAPGANPGKKQAKTKAAAEAAAESETKFAGVAELGSKEAYSTIVQAMSGARSDGLKAVERVNREQLDEARRQSDQLGRIATGIETMSRGKESEID